MEEVVSEKFEAHTNGTAWWIQTPAPERRVLASSLTEEQKNKILHAVNGIESLEAELATLRAQNRAYRATLEKIKLRSTPLVSDTDEDRKRDLFRIESYATDALAQVAK